MNNDLLSIASMGFFTALGLTKMSKIIKLLVMGGVKKSPIYLLVWVAGLFNLVFYIAFAYSYLNPKMTSQLTIQLQILISTSSTVTVSCIYTMVIIRLAVFNEPSSRVYRIGSFSCLIGIIAAGIKLIFALFFFGGLLSTGSKLPDPANQPVISRLFSGMNAFSQILEAVIFSVSSLAFLWQLAETLTFESLEQIIWEVFDNHDGFDYVMLVLTKILSFISLLGFIIAPSTFLQTLAFSGRTLAFSQTLALYIFTASTFVSAPILIGDIERTLSSSRSSMSIRSRNSRDDEKEFENNV